jgi:hypothetical protein
MGHVVLLGDSIIDNGAYVSGGSAIEPSEFGRSKISQAVQSVLLGHDFTRRNGDLSVLRAVAPIEFHISTP